MNWFRRRMRYGWQSHVFSAVFFLWKAAAAPFGWLWQVVLFLGSALASWWQSRQWRRLIWGIPILVVIAVVVTFAIKVSGTTSTEVAQRYVSAAERAANEGRYSASNLFFGRAVELGIRDRETLFDWAIVADKAGDLGVRNTVLARLAPDDRAVHVPAHLWRVVQLLSASPVTEQAAQMAEQQLRFVLQLAPENVNANSILGELYYQRGFYDAAAVRLAKADRSKTHYLLLHAKSCALTGKKVDAASSAERVIELTSSQIALTPRELAPRLEKAEAQLLKDQFSESIKTLSDALVLQSDEARIRGALARVYLAWAKYELRKEGPEDKKRLVAFQLTAEALRQNPDDPAVFDQLTQLVQLNDTTSEKVREFLRDNIANGRATGMSHMLLGASLLLNGDRTESGFHLEQAFKIMPEAPGVANNLAWYLVFQDPPDTERAMALITKVLEKFPNVPAYVDTRGQIYLRMKEWQKAIDDFQISLTQFSDQPELHKGLAEAYRALGISELADRHQLRFEQLVSSRPESKASDFGINTPRDATSNE